MAYDTGLFLTEPLSGIKAVARPVPEQGLCLFNTCIRILDEERPDEDRN
jgi:hypothetical protein